MKLVHTADWHLGFRQFDRLDPNGINQREQDVARTFARTLDLIAAEAPDVVLVAGDIFHQARPSNPAIVHAFQCLARFRRALPRAELILVAGNHDAPRTADAGSILQLFRALGVRVVERAAEVIELPALDLEVLAVPDVLGIERPPLRPSTTRAHRVLLLHGEIAGLLRVRTPHEIAPHELHADDWSYIALGHYHVYREVAPRAYYCGSLDYTSTDPWGELVEQRERAVPGKGFIVHDLAAGTHRFVPVGPSRPFLELGPIDAAARTVAELDAALEATVAGHPIDEAVVRVLLTDCPRHRVRELDQDALRRHRARALHFQLVPRPPETAAVALTVAETQRTTLAALVAAALRRRELTPDVPREAFVGEGLRYLREASADLTTTAVEA